MIVVAHRFHINYYTIFASLFKVIRVLLTFKYWVIHVLLMQDKTLFRAKKMVTLEKSRWRFDINLMFDGREFSLTNIPIIIDADDVSVLIPGTNIQSVKSGETLIDVVDIENQFQFKDIFREVLTDDAIELLSDVYTGRYWTAKIMDAAGNIRCESAYLSDIFYDLVFQALNETVPCWMEISFSNTTFNEDWTINVDEPKVIYSNIHNGMPPLNIGQAVSVLDMFTMISRFSDREEFRSTVTKQGNSLVLKITDQCRRMGVDVGDELNVILDRSNPVNNTTLRVFDSRHWVPIDDCDAICYLDNRDLSLVRRFLDDFKVIGTVKAGTFTPAFQGKPFYDIFDHLSFFKTSSGENIIVSQPYIASFTIKDAEEWAKMNGCSVEEHRDYSWHNPPDTTLIVFRRIENPLWKLPKSD